MLDFPNSSAAAGDPGGPSCAMHGASFALLVLAAVAAMATPPPPAGGPNMTGRTRPNSRNPQGKPYRKSLVEAPG